MTHTYIARHDTQPKDPRAPLLSPLRFVLGFLGWPKNLEIQIETEFKRSNLDRFLNFLNLDFN